MHSVTSWIDRKLGLKVNVEKSHIGRPTHLEYLGFGFYKKFGTQQWCARPHEEAVSKFQRKLKRLCKRSWSISMSDRVSRLDPVIRGWINYFCLSDMKKKMEKIDEHPRTMLRVVIWKQWKTPKKRAWGLRKLGISDDLAKRTSVCGNRYQWMVTKTCIVKAISKKSLSQKGLVSCLDYYTYRHALKTN